MANINMLKHAHEKNFENLGIVAWLSREWHGYVQQTYINISCPYIFMPNNSYATFGYRNYRILNSDEALQLLIKMKGNFCE